MKDPGRLEKVPIWSERHHFLYWIWQDLIRELPLREVEVEKPGGFAV